MMDIDVKLIDSRSTDRHKQLKILSAKGKKKKLKKGLEYSLEVAGFRPANPPQLCGQAKKCTPQVFQNFLDV